MTHFSKNAQAEYIRMKIAEEKAIEDKAFIKQINLERSEVFYKDGVVDFQAINHKFNDMIDSLSEMAYWVRSYEGDDPESYNKEEKAQVSYTLFEISTEITNIRCFSSDIEKALLNASEDLE